MVRRPSSYGAGLRTTLSDPLWSRFTVGLSAVREHLDMVFPVR